VLFTRCGTPGFVAPEVLGYQSGSKLYDEKCDIFSIGVIFYILYFFNKFFVMWTINDNKFIFLKEWQENSHFMQKIINKFWEIIKIAQ